MAGLMTQDEVSELRLIKADHTGLGAHAATWIYAAAFTCCHSSIGVQARKSGPKSHKTCGCGRLAAPIKGV
jgi:hypothetical protein